MNLIYWWSCNTNSQHLIALISTQNYSKAPLYINPLNFHKDLGGHRDKLNKFLIIKQLVSGRVGFGAKPQRPGSYLLHHPACISVASQFLIVQTRPQDYISQLLLGNKPSPKLNS